MFRPLTSAVARLLKRNLTITPPIRSSVSRRNASRFRPGVESLEAREVPAAVLLDQVIHGQVTVAYGSTSADFSLGQSVRFDHALVTATTRTAADWGTNATATIDLIDTDGDTATAEAVRVTRFGDGGTASSGALTADLSVAVFASGVTVQHLTGNFDPTANQVDLTLASTAPAGRSFVVLSSSAGGDMTQDSTWAVRGELASDTDLRLRRGQTGVAAAVAAQVVTFDADSGASVQTGTVSLSGGAAAVAYSPVAGQQPFLVFSNSAPLGGEEGKYRVRGSVSAAQATFATASSASPWVTYYLVFVPGATVQGGTAGFAAEASEEGSAAGIHTADAALGAAVDPSRSFALASASGGAGRIDALGDTSFTATLAGDGSGVHLERADRVDPAYQVSPLESAATASWSVVQLPGITRVSVTKAADAEEGAQNGKFTLTRSDTTGDLYVNFTLHGMATEGVDYSPSMSGQVHFAPGVAAVDVVIDVTGVYDDDEAESTETVILSVEDGDGYIPATNDTAVLLLADNDTIPPPRPVTELVVNTVEDDLDDTNNDTKFSLREAVLEANGASVSGSYIITFAATIQGQTISLKSTLGELRVDSVFGVTISVTIDGSAKEMTIQRDFAAPPTAKFRLFNNTAGTSLTLKNLQLSNGLADGAGGAVISTGELTIQHCGLGGNAASAAGGAIYFDGGTLIVVDSELALNSAQTGGAIHIGPNAKFVSIVNADIYENTADFGAGIYVDGSTNTTAPTYVSLYNVQVRRNTATTAGGGIYVGRNSVGLGTDLRGRLDIRFSAASVVGA